MLQEKLEISARLVVKEHRFSIQVKRREENPNFFSAGPNFCGKIIVTWPLPCFLRQDCISVSFAVPPWAVRHTAAETFSSSHPHLPWEWEGFHFRIQPSLFSSFIVYQWDFPLFSRPTSCKVSCGSLGAHMIKPKCIFLKKRMNVHFKITLSLFWQIFNDTDSASLSIRHHFFLFQSQWTSPAWPRHGDFFPFSCKAPSFFPAREFLLTFQTHLNITSLWSLFWLLQELAYLWFPFNLFIFLLFTLFPPSLSPLLSPLPSFF